MKWRDSCEIGLIRASLAALKSTQRRRLRAFFKYDFGDAFGGAFGDAFGGAFGDAFGDAFKVSCEVDVNDTFEGGTAQNTQSAPCSSMRRRVVIASSLRAPGFSSTTWVGGYRRVQSAPLPANCAAIRASALPSPVGALLPMPT